MDEPGYIYVLINPSMPGLVKIGKTNRDPSDRLGELSAATGVPTPFTLAYQVFVSNTTAAEEQVHTRLEVAGYRLVKNREFFQIPVHEAIDAVIEACRLDEPATVASNTKSRRPSNAQLSKENVWRDLLQEAAEYAEGTGNLLRDPEKAFHLYEQAAKLGSPEAARRLGSLFWDRQRLSSYLKRHKQAGRELRKAREYFETAVNLGDDEAIVGLARCFEHDQINFHKCWKKVFGSRLFRHLRDGSDDSKLQAVNYLYEYLIGGIELALSWRRTGPLAPHLDSTILIQGFTITQIVKEKEQNCPSGKNRSDWEFVHATALEFLCSRFSGAKISLDFKFIQPGEFWMGDDTNPTASPRHRVRITSGLEISTYPVFWSQWVVIMDSTACPNLLRRRASALLTWKETTEFIARLNTLDDLYSYRLPTEAEWEYACGSGSPEQTKTVRTVTKTGLHLPVRTKFDPNKPNDWGLCAMLGNEREWVSDWASDYQAMVAEDPTGPTMGQQRLMRGGKPTTYQDEIAAAERHIVNGDSKPREEPVGAVRLVRRTKEDE